MKKILLYVLLVVYGVGNLTSQSQIDPESIINSLDQVAQDVIEDPPQEKFVKGWNWGSFSKFLDDSLRMNFNHVHFYDWPNNEYKVPFKNIDNQYQVLSVPRVVQGDRAWALTQAQSVQYEVGWQFDDVDVVENQNDQTGAVFGFKTRHSNFDNANTNDHVFTMRKNDLMGASSAVVLEDAWPKDILFDLAHAKNDENVMPSDSTDANGREFFLTLRIRALETINSLNDDDVVLSIQLPYQAKSYDRVTNSNNEIELNWTNSNGMINFEEIPDENDEENRARPYPSTQDLGVYRSLTPATQNTNVLEITGAMLKSNSNLSSDNSMEFITISARFLCDGQDNPFLQDKEYGGIRTDLRGANNVDINENQDHIVELDMDVTYHGEIDVELDWIRIETPQYRNLLLGNFNEEIRDLVNDKLLQMDDLEPTLKVYRFFGIDEFWVSNWGSQRYLNKLLGGRLTGEIDEHVPMVNKFLHALEFEEFWTGDTKIFNNAKFSPSIYRGDKDVINSNGNLVNQTMPATENLGFTTGFYGLRGWNPTLNANIVRDTLRSGYETCIKRKFNDILDITTGFDKAMTEDIYNLSHNSLPAGYTKVSPQFYIDLFLKNI